MSEQVDIAVDLGAVPAPLPEILSLRQLVEVAPAPPPEIIEGMLQARECQRRIRRFRRLQDRLHRWLAQAMQHAPWNQRPD